MCAKRKILIIDAMSLAYRAFFSYPPNLKLADGQPINAVYGFVTMLFKALDDFGPEYVCVCFDRKEPTFRHEMYKEYKAHRPPAPEDFVSQIPFFRNILEKLDVHHIDCAGFEADDLIGTLAKEADSSNIQSLILTGDHDAFQLINENIHVLMNKRGVSDLLEYTPEKVKEKYGLNIDQLIDFKALKGDASDNIPGVLGIGEKTAVNLLSEFQDLDGIYKNIENISSKSVKAKLEAGKEMAFISKKLVTIDQKVPVHIDLDKMKYLPQWTEILKVFESFDFHSLFRKYKDKIDSETLEKEDIVKKAEGKYQLLDSQRAVKDMLPLLKNGFAVDLETTSKNGIEAQIVGIAIAIKETEAFYIPCNKYAEVKKDDTLPMFSEAIETKLEFLKNPYLEILKPILVDPTVPKYTHNGKYEYEVFRNYGIELKGIAFDTLIAAYLLFPGDRLGLKALVFRHFQVDMTTYVDVAGKGKSEISFLDVPIETARDYACADADYTLRLKNKFEPMIKEKFEKLYYDIELPVQDVLGVMECNGVKLDSDYLHKLSKEFASEIKAAEEKVFQLAGEEFNLGSPQQLAQILFEKFKITPIKKTKTGYSTDSFVLEKLAKEHGIAKYILTHRTYTKLENTYVKALPKLVTLHTDNIHTSFNQAVTATGRLSSSNPNLQNIPIKTDEGMKIRKAFIPSEKEGFIISADYSQIELRVFAHLAKDKNMIEAFQKGEDIHKVTAAFVFHKAVEEVTKEERTNAKTVNFGISYGQGAYALSEQLGVPRAEAQSIIDTYYAKFPAIKDFIDQTIEFARENEYVKTEFGRVRPISDIRATDFQRRSNAERIAVNTRVQGSAADIMKIAMIKVYQQMLKQNIKSKMIIQVHDELVFDVVETERAHMEKLIKENMEGAVELIVPLVVDIGIGKNWMEVS